MNDNTIIRIKVPARLYESVKAKLMIKENYEVPVKEEAEELKESPIVDVIAALSGVLGLGLTGVAITKAQDLLKKKNPELYNQLQKVSSSMKDQGVGLNEAKKLDHKKAAEDKKKAEEKKKKEAEAKKVADKVAADKKKAAEKKK
jgi:uncharacterized protein HemX